MSNILTLKPIRKRTYTPESRAINAAKSREYYAKTDTHYWWSKSTINRHKTGNGNPSKAVEILFTRDELIVLAKTVSNCCYCGKCLDWTKGKKKANNLSPTLDRIDNATVLHLHNVQIICRSCNTKKQNQTHDGFVAYGGFIWWKCGSEPARDFQI